MPWPQLLYLRGRSWEIRGDFTDSAVVAWPGSLGAAPWHSITIPCKCAKCWLLCGPDHCFIWQCPSFMPIETDCFLENYTIFQRVHWFIKGLDFFCSSVDASRPVLMLFWQYLVFVWLEIFQVIKKLHTNCCLKIYCVHIYFVYFDFGGGCFNSPSSLSESPMSRLGAQALLKPAKPESALKWSLFISYCLLFFTGNDMRRLCQKYRYCNYFIIPEYAQEIIIFKSGHPCNLQCLNLEVHTWKERELHPHSLSVLVTGMGLHWWALITHVSPEQGEEAFLCAQNNQLWVKCRARKWFVSILTPTSSV